MIRVRSRRVLQLLMLFLAGASAPLRAQDTMQVTYPWRESYFPYLTVSPNDGVMGLARVVWFQPSRWDDRTSVDRQVALEGGYSTRDAWLVRARGDFPRLAAGWRLQAFAEAGRYADYLPDNPFGYGAATREIAGAEVTRQLHGRLSIALRAEAMHVSIVTQPIYWAEGATFPGPTVESDVRSRLALVYDARDREYDTRSGLLLQGGMLGGSAGTGYAGYYALAGIWIPFGNRTRMTIRGGLRAIDENTFDAARVIPGWENEFVAGGGPESNRALPAGALANRDVELASAEIRHDLFTFPGGAVVLLAFVDGGRGYDDGDHVKWVWGPGGGVALRLLRNAVLTATAAHALGGTRIYVSSGWSW